MNYDRRPLARVFSVVAALAIAGYVVRELVLGHALRGVAGTYNVYDFETEKRDALILWSEELARS